LILSSFPLNAIIITNTAIASDRLNVGRANFAASTSFQTHQQGSAESTTLSENRNNHVSTYNAKLITQVPRNFFSPADETLDSWFLTLNAMSRYGFV